MKELPSLLITETNNEIGAQIEKGLTPASGRLSSDLEQNQLQWALSKGASYEEAHEFAKSCGALKPEATDTDVKPKKPGLSKDEAKLAKAMGFIISIGDLADPGQAATEACLRDTHGEQFSTDADREVVGYLTTVEKIDLANCPVHNPYAVQAGPQNGFPIARSERVAGALADLQKSAAFKPMPLPPKNGKAKVPKAPKDPLQVKQEREQRQDAGLQKGEDLNALALKAFA